MACSTSGIGRLLAKTVCTLVDYVSILSIGINSIDWLSTIRMSKSPSCVRVAFPAIAVNLELLLITIGVGNW